MLLDYAKFHPFPPNHTRGCFSTPLLAIYVQCSSRKVPHKRRVLHRQPRSGCYTGGGRIVLHRPPRILPHRHPALSPWYSSCPTLVLLWLDLKKTMLNIGAYWRCSSAKRLGENSVICWGENSAMVQRRSEEVDRTWISRFKRRLMVSTN